MFSRTRWMLSALLGAARVATTLAADSTEGMTKGTPDLKSAGPLAFGPDGILFVGDPQGAAIFTMTPATTPSAGPINVEKINEKVAAMPHRRQRHPHQRRRRQPGLRKRLPVGLARPRSRW